MALGRTNGGTEPCSIVLAQRQALMREVFVRLLEGVPALRIADHTDSIDAAVTVAAAKRPDVVVVDDLCVEIEGAAALARIKSASENSAVLLMTNDVDHGQIVAALACGADGIVLTSISVQALVDTIQRLVRRGPAPVLRRAPLGSA